MRQIAYIGWTAFMLTLMVQTATSQPVTTLQDSTLNNLIHETGYRTAPPGTPGVIVERGNGPVLMILISGFGLGASGSCAGAYLSCGFSAL